MLATQARAAFSGLEIKMHAPPERQDYKAQHRVAECVAIEEKTMLKMTAAFAALAMLSVPVAAAAPCQNTKANS